MLRRRAGERRRRGPTPSAGASATCSSTRPRTSTRCSTGCSTCSSAAATTSSSSATRRRRSTASTAPIPALLLDVDRTLPGRRGRSACRQPPLHAADRRRRRRTCSRPAGRPRDAVVGAGRRPAGADRRPPTTRTTRRRWSPRSCAPLDPAPCAPGAVAVLARTNAQLPRLGRGARRRRRPGPARRSWPPARRSPRRCGRRRRCHRRAGCAAGPTTCSTPTPADGARRRSTAAERRVAAAVLDFLRDQPLGDGAALRVVGRDDRPVRRRRRSAASSCSRSTAPRAGSGTPSS